jgi:hypothetical protein
MFKILGMMLLISQASFAAEMTKQQRQQDWSINISGIIDQNDFDQFKALTAGITTATIQLKSPGGNMLAALSIGEKIHDSGWFTYVGPDDSCASACANIWLAGKARFASSRSRICFHGASLNGQGSTMGDAFWGAYMTKLGLSYGAILYLAQANADSINCINFIEATKAGIEITLWEPPNIQVAAQIKPVQTEADPFGEKCNDKSCVTWLRLGIDRNGSPVIGFAEHDINDKQRVIDAWTCTYNKQEDKKWCINGQSGWKDFYYKNSKGLWQK